MHRNVKCLSTVYRPERLVKGREESRSLVGDAKLQHPQFSLCVSCHLVLLMLNYMNKTPTPTTIAYAY